MRSPVLVPVPKNCLAYLKTSYRNYMQKLKKQSKFHFHFLTFANMKLSNAFIVVYLRKTVAVYFIVSSSIYQTGTIQTALTLNSFVFFPCIYPNINFPYFLSLLFIKEVFCGLRKRYMNIYFYAQKWKLIQNKRVNILILHILYL